MTKAKLYLQRELVNLSQGPLAHFCVSNTSSSNKYLSEWGTNIYNSTKVSRSGSPLVTKGCAQSYEVEAGLLKFVESRIACVTKGIFQYVSYWNWYLNSRSPNRISFLHSTIMLRNVCLFSRIRSLFSKSDFFFTKNIRKKASTSRLASTFCLWREGLCISQVANRVPLFPSSLSCRAHHCQVKLLPCLNRHHGLQPS